MPTRYIHGTGAQWQIEHALFAAGCPPLVLNTFDALHRYSVLIWLFTILPRQLQSEQVKGSLSVITPADLYRLGP